MHPKLLIVSTIAVTGFVCPSVIGGIALWQEKVLTGGQNVVAKNTDDSRLAL